MMPYRLPDLCLADVLAAVPGENRPHFRGGWPSGVQPGLEPEVIMLGEFATAERLRGALESPMTSSWPHCTLVEDWTSEHETPSERVCPADAALLHTPSVELRWALLVLCQMPGKDRKDLRERQRRLFSCVRDLAARAEDAGVGNPTFHPNSPEGSLFRTSEDYEILVGGLRAPWASHRTSATWPVAVWTRSLSCSSTGSDQPRACQRHG